MNTDNLISVPTERLFEIESDALDNSMTVETPELSAHADLPDTIAALSNQNTNTASINNISIACISLAMASMQSYQHIRSIHGDGVFGHVIK